MDCPPDFLTAMKNVTVSHYYVPTYVVETEVDLTVRVAMKAKNSTHISRDFRQFQVTWSRNIIAATEAHLKPFTGFIGTAFSKQKQTVVFDDMQQVAQTVLKQTISQGAAKSKARELLRDKAQFAAEKDQMANKLFSESPNLLPDSAELDVRGNISNDDLSVVFVPISVIKWDYAQLRCQACATGTYDNGKIKFHLHERPSKPENDSFLGWSKKIGYLMIFAGFLFHFLFVLAFFLFLFRPCYSCYSNRRATARRNARVAQVEAWCQREEKDFVKKLNAQY